MRFCVVVWIEWLSCVCSRNSYMFIVSMIVMMKVMVCVSGRVIGLIC